ncbi:MAG TPA: cytochrome c maturation protein CcmE [Bacteroidota bacterium]|nr:cytochrome c maturation protein CcmE [Bacteroidota bacterium]
MRVKIIVASVVVAAFLVFGAVSFLDSNVEYTDFAKAERTSKKVQVKGSWVRDKETTFDAQHGQFIFYMKDDNQREAKVILDGAKPNNFELATSVVAKGRFKDGSFHANELLTKCPSKYEGDASAVKKTL